MFLISDQLLPAQKEKNYLNHHKETNLKCLFSYLHLPKADVDTLHSLSPLHHTGEGNRYIGTTWQILLLCKL